jgi:hypothetical protein
MAAAREWLLIHKLKNPAAISMALIRSIGVDEYKNMQSVLHYAVAGGQAIGDALVEAGKDYYRHKPTFAFLRR